MVVVVIVVVISLAAHWWRLEPHILTPPSPFHPRSHPFLLTASHSKWKQSTISSCIIVPPTLPVLKPLSKLLLHLPTATKTTMTLCHCHQCICATPCWLPCNYLPAKIGWKENNFWQYIFGRCFYMELSRNSDHHWLHKDGHHQWQQPSHFLRTSLTPIPLTQ